MQFTNKPFIYCASKEVFNTLKRSTGISDDSYVIGDSTEVITGSPDILWQQICFIKDTNQIYTYGSFYNRTTISKLSMTDTTATIEPNQFYVWGEVSSLDISLATPQYTGMYNEYMFQFTSGDTATTLTLPSTIKWSSTLSIKANMTYQVSIVENIGVIYGTSNS